MYFTFSTKVRPFCTYTVLELVVMQFSELPYLITEPNRFDSVHLWHDRIDSECEPSSGAILGCSSPLHHMVHRLIQGTVPLKIIRCW